MRENIIIKWILQFLLSSLLSFLMLEYGPNFLGYGRHVKAVIVLFCIPFASIAGIVLGDISLYRGKKLINLAIIIAFILAVIGGILSGFIGELLNKYFSNYANRWFWINRVPYFPGQIAMLPLIIILPLIGYNAITSFGSNSSSKQEMFEYERIRVSMKEKVIKWFLQISLGSLLFLLASTYLPCNMGMGVEGIFSAFILWPLASTIGVVLADISLYKGEELYSLAIVISFVFAVIGLFVGALFAESTVLRMHIAPFLFYSPVVILSLISYNIVANRKRRSANEAKKQ